MQFTSCFVRKRAILFFNREETFDSEGKWTKTVVKALSALETRRSEVAELRKKYISLHTSHLALLDEWINKTEPKETSSTQMTPWSWALLERPPVAHLSKNFPTLHGTRRFIPVFLTHINPIHFTPSHYSNIHFNTIQTHTTLSS
jgi:hypothetical protein